MRHQKRIAVVIPALNEAASIGRVLEAIPEWVDDVVVADNGSVDDTPRVAAEHGARVVTEPQRGYGAACLKGIAALNGPDVVVFLDGDFSDHPEDMDTLVDPILLEGVDMVIGSRTAGRSEPGALTPQARFGNRLACFLIRLFWGVKYTDLGPFRAIRYKTLKGLGMRDRDYGWTVEMQIKAALHGASAIEVPVDYRKRIGKSKVSGTLRGVVGAGYKILGTIFVSAIRHYFSRAKLEGSERLIIFTRFPEPGITKTRLIPALGPEGAADLQRKMTAHAVNTFEGLEGTELEIWYAGGDEESMAGWLGSERVYRPQGEGDLGDRMGRAFTAALSDCDRAVLIGIDSPEITEGILRAAFHALDDHDVVLGPATDGGYYLVGLRRGALRAAVPALFEGVEWGTEKVYGQTCARIREQELVLRTLAPLDDVDRPEDLGVWERAMEGSGPPEAVPGISVIVPTFNEAGRILATIEPLLGETGVEVIVVDGGSSDGTADLAREAGATVLMAPRGRAGQMNRGSAHAQGAYLLFLHGDTVLSSGFASTVRRILSESGNVAGAFRFATDDRGISLRIIAFWANCRSKWLQMPYGDQALFVTKDRFRAMGGLAELPIMEDFEFVRRLRREGHIAIADIPAVTSARRWRKMGPWRTMIANQLVVGMYLLGVSPERIAGFYTRQRGVR